MAIAQRCLKNRHKVVTLKVIDKHQMPSALFRMQ